MRCRHAHAESSRRASGVTGRQPPARLTLRFWRPDWGARARDGHRHGSRRTPRTGHLGRRPPRAAYAASGRAPPLPRQDPSSVNRSELLARNGCLTVIRPPAPRQAGARPAGQPVVLRAGAAGSIRRDPRRRPHPRVQRPRRSRHRHPHVARADRRRGTRCAGRARDDGARRHGRDTEPQPDHRERDDPDFRDAAVQPPRRRGMHCWRSRPNASASMRNGWPSTMERFRPMDRRSRSPRSSPRTGSR